MPADAVEMTIEYCRDYRLLNSILLEIGYICGTSHCMHREVFIQSETVHLENNHLMLQADQKEVEEHCSVCVTGTYRLAERGTLDSRCLSFIGLRWTYLTSERRVEQVLWTHSSRV